MIYLLAIAFILTIAGFGLKIRRRGVSATILDMTVAIGFGFSAGILIGIGARVGMWAIAFANGDASRLSFSGTLRVIATFACLGIAFGLIYEGLLRQVLRQNGLVYGILITLCAWYPLSEAAAQSLRFEPTPISQFIWSGVCVAFMFIPFSLVLEWLLQLRIGKQPSLIRNL